MHLLVPNIHIHVSLRKDSKAETGEVIKKDGKRKGGRLQQSLKYT